MDAPSASALHEAVLAWYDDHARELPWRGVAATPWSVMVSELMLQQTPVARVLPVHAAWLERWPTPADLAAESTGEAVRMWGRLGYPRRALRLHAAAVAIVERHDGAVPTSYDDLLALPGVGDYTASAIASFAFGQRHVVLDTNVRRVLARAVSGVEFPAPAVTRAERDVATSLLPDDAGHRGDVGGRDDGAGRARLHRAPAVVRRLPDRRALRVARRRLPGVRRSAAPRPGVGRHRPPVPRAHHGARPRPVVRSTAQVEQAWPEREQRERCLAGLVDDGLLTQITPGRWALPG